MANAPDAFVYNATLDRIVDGDTLDCILDLGFDVKLHKQRVRLAGIDTPESRTRDLAEKKLGLAAKERLKEICSGKFKIKSLGKKVFNTIIPRNVRISEAPSHGKPAIIYDYKCSGSSAYMKLAKEFINRKNINEAA